MASFCKKCSIDIFGEDYEDFAGITTPKDTAEGFYACVLCEDCGPCQVDHTGTCVSEDCMKKHGAKSNVYALDEEGHMNTTIVQGVVYPHCDFRVLHAPGTCDFCDEHPDWQEERVQKMIAFTNQKFPFDRRVEHPCPSTLYREPDKINAWVGNRPFIGRKFEQDDDEAGLHPDPSSHGLLAKSPWENFLDWLNKLGLI